MDNIVTMRHDFRAIVAGLPPLEPSTLLNPPVVGVDESCNHPLIERLAVQLHVRFLAEQVTPLWNQRRIRADGSVLYVVGGVPSGTTPETGSPCDLGKPEKGARWEDQDVIAFLLAFFTANAPLVLLSENTRRDQFGLRRILSEHVRPSLEARTDGYHSLTAYFKRGRTTYPEYCRLLLRHFALRSWPRGYREILL